MDNITLLKGSHNTRDQGVCIMEAVAWFAGESHSDAPQCACPVIASFALRLNDRLDNEDRQRLKPLIPALALSRAEWPVPLQRTFVAVDYAVRVFAPIALEAWGHQKDATRLRYLAPIIDKASAKKAADTAAYAASTASAAFYTAYVAAYAASYAAASAAAASYTAANAASYAAAASAAASAAACSRRLADLSIECLEKMLAIKE